MSELTQSAGPLAALGINPKLFFAQIVNFAVVLFIAWKWVYKPLLAAMDERSKKIAQGLDDAEAIKKSLAETEAQEKELIGKARDEAHALLEAVKTDAEKEHRALLAKAHEEMERELAETRTRLAAEKTQTLTAIKAEIGGLITESLQKALPRVLDASAQKKLVEFALEEVKAEKRD